MPATFLMPLITQVPGALITSSAWNNEWINVYNNLIPAGIDTYSATDLQMQTSTDPFPSGTSHATSLAGEIERLRYILNLIIGQSFWYQHPQINLSTLNGYFPGGLLTNANIALQTITAAQILNNTITAAQIANGVITTTQIAAAAGILGSQLSASAGILGSQLSGSAAITGSQLAAAAGITGSQIASATVAPANLTAAVPAAVGLKSLNSYTVSASTTLGDGTSKTFNQAITSVNTAKAVPILTAVTSSANADNVPVPGYTLSLTSATNLRLVTSLLNNPTGTDTWSFIVSVIEFN